MAARKKAINPYNDFTEKVDYKQIGASSVLDVSSIVALTRSSSLQRSEGVSPVNKLLTPVSNDYGADYKIVM